MANTSYITEFPVEYLNALDEVLVRESFSSKYDVGGTEFVTKKTVKVPRIEFKKGMVDYDGFKTDTGASMTYDTYELDADKQAVFSVDAVEDVDTAHILSTNLNSEFLRTEAVPEMDKHFFTAVEAQAKTKATAKLTVANIKAELRKARTQMRNAGVSAADLYMSADALALLEDAIDRQFAGEGAITDAVGKYNMFTIYTPPEDRLADLDFAVVAPNTIRFIKKRAVTYLFAPGTHTSGDCWLSQSRWVYGAVTYENKKPGLYVNKSATTGA